MPTFQKNTPDSELDRFNDQLRASAAWQNFMRANGIDLSRPVRLSDQQRKALQTQLQRSGIVTFGKGLEIDQAGNVNQDEGFSKYWNNPWIRYPVLAGGALATAGALGAGPLAGVFGGGSGAAGAAGAAMPAFDSLPAISSAAGAANAAAIGGAPSLAALLGAAPSAGVGSAVAGGAGAAGAGNALTRALRAAGLSPRDLVGLGASAIPAIVGSGGGNPFSSDEERALYDEARQGLAMQRRRAEQTQPIFDDLVRRAEAYAPNANYGGPAYTYEGPHFGGR